MDFSKIKSLYSTDEEMLELEDQDVTATVIGYVEATRTPIPSGVKNEMLFKFILTNGRKRLVVLIWGDCLINKYCKDICFSRIININGGYCKTVSLTAFKKKNNYVPFEIIIRENTEVSFLGYHLTGEEINNQVQKATFDNVHTMQGLIEISGYVRTKFSIIHTRSGLLSYGLGAITDGTKKITIQVEKFEDCNFELGDYVTVTGSVKGQDSIVAVFCESMDNIKYDPEKEALSLEQVNRGRRPVKRARMEEDN